MGAVFDESKPFAKSTGVKSIRVLKNSQNPNEVVTIGEFVDMAAALKAGQHTDEMKEVRQRSGMVIEPTMYMLEVDNVTKN